MPPPRDQSAAVFAQFAALFTVMVTVIPVAGMGMVNGLRFRWVFLGLGTVRGVPAQIIGGLCVLAEAGGVALLVNYIGLLSRYCGTSTGCFVMTPIASLLANWPAIIWIAMVEFVFIRWARLRHEELVVLTGAYSFVLPSVHHYVNGTLTLSHERRMSRPEVRQIMDFVKQHASAVVLGKAYLPMHRFATRVSAFRSP